MAMQIVVQELGYKIMIKKKNIKIKKCIKDWLNKLKKII